MPFKVLLSLLALLVRISSTSVYYGMGCKTAVGMPFKVVLLSLLALLVRITSTNVYYGMGCKTAVGMPFKVLLIS
jgi:hypothetical protein